VCGVNLNQVSCENSGYFKCLSNTKLLKFVYFLVHLSSQRHLEFRVLQLLASLIEFGRKRVTLRLLADAVLLNVCEENSFYPGCSRIVEYLQMNSNNGKERFKVNQIFAWEIAVDADGCTSVLSETHLYGLAF